MNSKLGSQNKANSLELNGETIAELEMLVGFDDNLVSEATGSPTGCAACSRRSTRAWRGRSAAHQVVEVAGVHS